MRTIPTLSLKLSISSLVGGLNLDIVLKMIANVNKRKNKPLAAANIKNIKKLLPYL